MSKLAAEKQHLEEGSWFLEHLVDHAKLIILACVVGLIFGGFAAAKAKLFEDVPFLLAPLFLLPFMPLMFYFVSAFMWLWVRLFRLQRLGWLFDTKAGWRHNRERGWYLKRRSIFPSWRYSLYDPQNPPVNWSFDQKPGWYYDGVGNWTYRESVRVPSWRYELYDPQNPPIMPAQHGVPLPPLGFAKDSEQGAAK